LVIAVHGSDVIVLGLFSRVPPVPLKNIWLLISDNDPTFPPSGLKKTSLLRAEKIAVIHESVFHSRLGRLTDRWITQADQALKHALQLS
jgi:mRNA interferase MazF